MWRMRHLQGLLWRPERRRNFAGAKLQKRRISVLRDLLAESLEREARAGNGFVLDVHMHAPFSPDAEESCHRVELAAIKIFAIST
jgi:hypothetical protein